MRQVMIFRDLLPTPAWRGKLRAEGGDWRRFEDDVSERTEARFTHGMCPDCSARMGGGDEPRRGAMQRAGGLAPVDHAGPHQWYESGSDRPLGGGPCPGLACRSRWCRHGLHRVRWLQVSGRHRGGRRRLPPRRWDPGLGGHPELPFRGRSASWRSARAGRRGRCGAGPRAGAPPAARRPRPGATWTAICGRTWSSARWAVLRSACLP